MTLNQNGPGLQHDGSTSVADAYYVTDMEGNTVGSGSIPPVRIFPPGGVGTIVGATITITPTSGGTFPPGSYRVHLTGPTNDSYLGHAYGGTFFLVLRDNPNFFHNPDSHGASEDSGAESRDPVLKGVLGMNGSRLQVINASLADPANPYYPGTNVPPGSYTGDSLWSSLSSADAILAYQPADPARTPTPIFCQFPNGSVDGLSLFTVGNVYCKDGTVDGSKVFVGCGPGTSSGIQVTVRYPNNTTIVETWDNYATPALAAAAINNLTTGSHYIHLVPGSGISTKAPAAIGNAYFKGVVNTVQYLFSHGVTYYEGPSNEPNGAGGPNAETAHQMKIFQAAVKAGNSNAKAMGPCAVSINELASWRSFFDAGGGDSCDAIATHMYGAQFNGEINQGRLKLAAWFDLLDEYGQSEKDVWVTESTQAGGASGIALNPMVTRYMLSQILLLEQYGVARNRNLIWYDRSHGFWNVPNFLEYSDTSVASHGLLCRVMAEETLGMLHHHAIDFGFIGNRIFLGSIFKHISDGTQTAMILTSSAMPGATITFGVTGTVPASFVRVDGKGNSSTISVSAGKFTVPLDAYATYVRIPAGTYLYVSTCNGWPDNTLPSISQSARGTLHGTQYAPGLVDGSFLTDYASGAGFVISRQPVPDTVEAIWNSTVSAERVIIFAGIASQPYSTLTDFDVETTADGTTWTKRQTVFVDILDKTFVFPTDFHNAGSTIEGYWNPRYVFDIPFGSTLTFKGIRLNVRATSWGGSNIQELAGQYGNPTQLICLQEIVVPSASVPTPYNSTSFYNLLKNHTGTLGFWRFGEPDGATVGVSEVNSSTVNGVYQVTPPNTSTTVPGPVSDGATARKSIGGANFFVAANPTLHFGDTFTFVIFHNAFSNPTDGGQILQIPLPNGQQIDVHWNGGLNYSISDHASVLLASTAISGGADGNWHLIVITHSGATTKIYVDAFDATVPGGTKTFPNGDGRLLLTSTGGASNGFGDLAVLNVALSQSEVIDLFNAATVPTTVPVIDDTFFAPNPVLSGTPYVGEQLQCSEGLWRNNPTGYRRQWMVSADGASGWTNVSGATRSDFLIDNAELNKFARCQVIAFNIIGDSAPQYSNVIGPIGSTPGVFTNITLPFITGTPTPGSTLTCDPGTWTGSPTNFFFKWRVSADGVSGWSEIAGATNQTYVVPSLYLGMFLDCGVAVS